MNIFEKLAPISFVTGDPSIFYNLPSFYKREEKKCAIIGSAGLLLDYSYGKEIDSHDFIIRFGQAPTLGYENYVGSKTDMRILTCHEFTPYRKSASKKDIEYLKNIFCGYDEKFLESTRK